MEDKHVDEVNENFQVLGDENAGASDMEEIYLFL